MKFGYIDLTYKSGLVSFMSLWIVPRMESQRSTQRGKQEREFQIRDRLSTERVAEAASQLLQTLRRFRIRGELEFDPPPLNKLLQER